MDRQLISGNSEELIGKLREKYNLAKSSVYQRLKFLDIKVRKENGEAFINSNELEMLDQLHDHIGSGNTLESFSKPGLLVQSEASEIDQADLEFEPIEVESGHQVRQLVRTAQEKAAGVLIAQNMLAAQFKDNPHMMDEDLQQQIRKTEEAIAPKSLNPMDYARSLMKQITQSQIAA